MLRTLEVDGDTSILTIDGLDTSQPFVIIPSTKVEGEEGERRGGGQAGGLALERTEGMHHLNVPQPKKKRARVTTYAGRALLVFSFCFLSFFDSITYLK